MEEIILKERIEEPRYSRLRLIEWWEQEKLSQAFVMVVGVGALGNEILKNLALLGVGKIIIIDFDKVEPSNLSRCLLFREEDEDSPKAMVALKRLAEINPQVKVVALNSDIRYEVGLGLFKEVDLVIAGLDNREARLFINQACYKMNTPWIDGAIDVLSGVAKLFIPPDPPCYECTLNQLDYKIISERKSCQFIPISEELKGKIPTTPTISSIIAGIQVQEAVKLLHGRKDFSQLKGKGFFLQGQFLDSYIIEYQEKEECPSHDTYKEIIPLNKKVSETKLRELMDIANKYMGEEAIVELEQEIAMRIRCKKCGYENPIFKSLGKLNLEEVTCPHCNNLGFIDSTHTIKEDLNLELTLMDIGIPPWDIVTIRNGRERIHLEFNGDREDILKF
jgi:adenylyltransferase/sulfurtransferase